MKATAMSSAMYLLCLVSLGPAWARQSAAADGPLLSDPAQVVQALPVADDPAGPSGSTPRVLAGAGANPGLTWVATPGGVEEAGELVVINLWMTDLGGQEAAGFQAFVTFDSTRLEFVSGGYTDVPFGLPVIDPIVAVGENIDLASGINQLEGQVPTSEDSLLVELTFITLEPGCITGLSFREHEPPTRMTDIVGNAIEPLDLTGLPEEAPTPDINNDGVVNPSDLALLLGAWGPCIGPPSACCNADGVGGCEILDELACAAAGGEYLPEADCSACPPAACGAGAGDCCSANATPGCDEVDCCVTVCDIDPDCCDIEWDGDCAAQAETLCPPCFPPPANDMCVDSLPIFDGNTAFDTTGATTDGPEHPGCDATNPQTFNDTWYDYDATCTGPLTVSVCDQADYDTKLVVYDGCGDCDNLQLLGCNDDAVGCSGFTSEVFIPGVLTGNCYKIRMGGTSGIASGSGTITITCGSGAGTSALGLPLACPADLNCDGDVNAADLALLLGAWGPYPPS